MVWLRGIDGSQEVVENVSKNSFRRIPVFSTAQEIMASNEPKIEWNIINGKYNSVDHYLDIHYRLREDFVRPLRRGIQECVKCLNSGQDIYKIQDIYVYENVKFLWTEFHLLLDVIRHQTPQRHRLEGILEINTNHLFVKSILYSVV